MKKTAILLFAASIFGLTSCDIGSGDTTQSMSYGVINLVSPTDGTTPSASVGWYNLEFNFTQNNVTVSLKDLVIDNVTHTLVTEPLSYTGSQAGDLITIKDFSGYLDNNQSLPITNASFEVSTRTYPYPNTDGSVSTTSTYGFAVVLASYDIGTRYKVKTFYPDVCYNGTTTTQYPNIDGTTSTFSNGDIIYRVVFQQDLKKANVAIYNAKFAEAAPTLGCITLEDLNVRYYTGGYELSGENIVPKVVEGGASTPNEKYTFNSFKLTPSGNLTDAIIEYTVADVYKGYFRGSYIKSAN